MIMICNLSSNCKQHGPSALKYFLGHYKFVGNAVNRVRLARNIASQYQCWILITDCFMSRNLEWEDEYCSNQCVVLHCDYVFRYQKCSTYVCLNLRLSSGEGGTSADAIFGVRGSRTRKKEY